MALTTRPKGLANLGNTCFLNSELQCLSATGIVKIMKPDPPNDTPHRQIYNALKQTLLAMGNPETRPMLSPQTLVMAVRRNARALGRPDFAGWEQNDVAEFHTMLGDCIHEATKSKAKVKITMADKAHMTPVDQKCLERLTEYIENEHSMAARTMAGIEASVVTTTNDIYLSTKAECFYVLVVPVPIKQTIIRNPQAPLAPITVADCVAEFGTKSFMVGENQYEMPEGFPNAGEHVDAIQKHLVWLAPQILMIETRLYRMTPQGEFRKGYERLVASQVLELPIWSAGEHKKARYTLCGVAYHRGGNLMGGHYTAVVKTKDGTLYNCNDTSIAPLAQGAQWPNGGYCYFYRKIM
jgi:ubiquitin carboxyl-terminal hydrolase 2/21